MPVRASDMITLSVLASVTYVRTYYLLQASTLGAPAKPTTNPPSAPWTTTEPNYTAGSTNTLYTVSLTVYGTAGFEYGDVQKSSSYEAAKQAYNLAEQASATAVSANGKVTVAAADPLVADGAGKPAGSMWYRRGVGSELVGMWEWTGSAWAPRIMTDSMVGNLSAASITTGTFSSAFIGTDAIKAINIETGALDGKLITGLNMQTVATALRGIKINNTGILAYTSTGVNTVNINATTGAVSIVGDFASGSGNSIFKATTAGIQLGNATFASAPFRVTAAGALFATNATITGAITATSGSITGTLELAGGGQLTTDTTSLTKGVKFDRLGIRSYNNTTGAVEFRLDSGGGGATLGNTTLTGDLTFSGGTIRLNTGSILGDSTTYSTELYNGALKQQLKSGGWSLFTPAELSFGAGTYGAGTVQTILRPNGITAAGAANMEGGMTGEISYGIRYTGTDRLLLSATAGDIDIVTMGTGKTISLVTSKLNMTVTDVTWAGLPAANNQIVGSLGIGANNKLVRMTGAPIATAAGTVTTASVINATTGINIPVTFPVGRFSKVPIVTANADSSRLTVSANAITIGGCNLRVDNWSTGGAAGTTIGWQAMQMTEDSSAG